jgi:uncharacterized protein YcfJ
MKKSLVFGFTGGLIVATAGGALAGYQVTRTPAYAEVVSVTPLSAEGKPERRTCHDERVTHHRDPRDEQRIMGTVAGALLGSLLGHQLGGGSGRTLATVAGAAAGGYAGNRIQRHAQERATVTTTERRCTTTDGAAVGDTAAGDTMARTTLYEVRYRLNGRMATVRMDHDPGLTLPVRDGQVVADEPGSTAT